MTWKRPTTTVLSTSDAVPFGCSRINLYVVLAQTSFALSIRRVMRQGEGRARLLER